MRLSSRRESETSDHHDDPNRMLTHTFSLETEPHIELASRSQSESCRSFHGSL